MNQHSTTIAYRRRPHLSPVYFATCVCGAGSIATNDRDDATNWARHHEEVNADAD